MRVVNICTDDWANFSHANAKALRSIGVKCHDYKQNRHIFNYTEESIIKPIEAIDFNEYDVIQIFHSDLRCLEFVKGLNKKIVVYHTGTPYRERPQFMNEQFNPYVSISFSDHLEFHKLGAKNYTYIATAIDTDYIKYVDNGIVDKIRFAHYPSNEGVKGTKEIIRMMQGIDCYFNHSTFRKDYAQQLQRMADCDVYIELFNKEIGGKEYGHYGVTAFEAAALGRMVITQCPYKELYKQYYNAELPFFICNNEKKFKETISNIIDSPMINEYKREMREWIEQYHSLEATGKYILKHLEE